MSHRRVSHPERSPVIATFAALVRGADPRAGADIALARRPGRQDRLEALGLLLGTLGILLGLVLTIGGAIPFGQ